MPNNRTMHGLCILLAAATALTAVPALAEEQARPVSQPTGDPPALEEQFRDPPAAVRPRVWWHWMNGNISKDGIAKDLAWMKRIGIGGLQNFDANLNTPQIVEKRLIYMQPDWKDAFRFAAKEADRLGLELTIAASPGWSETGGPWVKPEDGLKKLVWSETRIAGGKRFKGKLPAPPTITGPFQSVPKQAGIEQMLAGGSKPEAGPGHYGDVAVLAVPDRLERAFAAPVVSDGAGQILDYRLLTDGDHESNLPIKAAKQGEAPLLHLTYPTPVTVRSASLFIPGGALPFIGAAHQPKLEASDDGTNWRTVAEISVAQVPSTASFSAVTARHFRLRFEPRPPRGLPMGETPGVVDNSFGALVAGMANRPVNVGDLRLSPEARIDSFETKAGFSISRDYFALAEPKDGAAGVSPANIIDITSRLQPDGSLAWTPPKGNWRILRLGYSLLGTTNHPAPPEATGLEVDKFDGPAVRRYLETYLGLYKDAAGADMIGAKGVRALLTDSIEVGAANWTPQMVSQFKRLRGYDPTPWLPALTGTLIGTRAESDKFLFDYRRTLADLMASEHYGTVAKVAHENGLKVYGEALEDHRPTLGDDMAMRRYADVPMAAMWTHDRKTGPRQTYVADIKGAASVAHIYGQDQVAAESLTSASAPWAFSPNDLKRIIDLEFVNGVNLPVIHTSVHQPVDDKQPGLTLFIFGQYFNRHETWAELARPWVDYIARHSLMLQQGRNVADVGYFYGEEGPLTALYGDNAVADAPHVHAYDFVNAEALLGALTNDGADLVSPGGARYHLLYLGGSSRKMSLPVLRRIATLAEGGATIVGMRPEGDPGLGSDATAYDALAARLWSGGGETLVGKGRIIASKDVEAALARIGISPDFRFSGASEGARIPFVHRRLTDGDSYFLVNQKDRAETIEARFRVTGKIPELWRAETGTSEPLSYRIENGETIVPLSLAADEAVHVVFRKPATASALAIKTLEPVALAAVTSPWSVTFQPGRGAPASITLPRLMPLNEHDTPGIKYFSGVATYATTIEPPRGWAVGQPLWLDLGEAKEVAEIIVNGTSVGHAWHAPYRVEIGGALRPGKNRLEVRVANLWVNRLIGDAQPYASKIAWTPMPTYRTDAPLRRSGLIGPVQLWGQAKR